MKLTRYLVLAAILAIGFIAGSFVEAAEAATDTDQNISISTIDVTATHADADRESAPVVEVAASLPDIAGSTSTIDQRGSDLINGSTIAISSASFNGREMSAYIPTTYEPNEPGYSEGHRPLVTHPPSNRVIAVARSGSQLIVHQ